MVKMLKKIIVSEEASLGEATKAMDSAGLRMILVCAPGNKLIGILSYGDIRRAYLEGVPSSKLITGLYNPFPVTATTEDSLKRIKELSESKMEMLGGRIQVPIINKEGIVVNLAVADKKGSIEFISKKKGLKNQNLEKILVTGGAGYLGSTLVRKLLEEGYKVRVLDKLSYGKESLKDIMQNPDFELVVGNILDIQDVVESAKDVDAVVHLAAIVGDEASSANPIMSVEENTIATINLGHVCKIFQINRFIFTSTCSVYGASENGELLTEDSLLFPVSLYAQSKIDSEIELKRLIDGNFSPTILRLATLYGWSYRPRFDLVVNLFTLMALHNKEVTVFGGGQWRPFLSVSDAARAIIQVLESPIEKVGGQIFNVGSSENNYTIEQIADTICKLVKNARYKLLDTNSDLRNYRVSFEKIKKTLDYKTRSDMKEEVGIMIKEIKATSLKSLLKKGFNSPGLIKNFQ